MLLRNYICAKPFLVSLIILLPASGCAITPVTQQANYPVVWTAEYQMPDLLSETIAVNHQKDLQLVLDAPWYAEIYVENAKSSKQIALGNCSQYLSEMTESTHPLRENEINAFLEFATMCRSTQLLLNASSAKKSNIPADILTPSMPDELPVAMAFQTSTSEAIKNSENTPDQYWASINPNLKFTPLSKDRVKFFDDSGSQTISLLGSGDFNADGVEDVLISSRDAVAGGSYFNIRLFALTVDTQGKWVLIKEFSY